MNVKPEITPASLANIATHILSGSASRPAFSLLFDAKSAIIQKSVIVPDVSFWQDRDDTPNKIDFAKMKANGAAGCIIRAGQGGWDDEDFSDYWLDSYGKFPRGIYWFYDSQYKPGDQALRIKELFKNRVFPEMEIWCDYEETYNGSYAGWKHFAVFIDEIRRLIPWAKIGIYTGYYYWLAHSPNPITEKPSFDWFAQFPLWLAWYTNDPAIVKIPQPWTKVTYWQYTATGDGPAYGVESKGIDLSYFNGTRVEFDARYGVKPPVPDPEPDPVPVITLYDISPKPTVKTTVILKVDGEPMALTFTPPAPDPEPEPDTPPAGDFPHLYRIKDDFAAGIEPTGTRPYIRDGLPATVRMRGVTSAFKLPQPWIDFVSRCNGGDKKRMNYLFKKDSGWQNSAEQYKVETLTFAGNVVNVTRIEGNRAYIQSYHANETPPAGVIIPRENSLHPLVQMFSVGYNNKKRPLDMSTDGRYCLTLILVPAGESPWIDLRDLERLP